MVPALGNDRDFSPKTGVGLEDTLQVRTTANSGSK